jgi:hypothetical protein
VPLSFLVFEGYGGALSTLASVTLRHVQETMRRGTIHSRSSFHSSQRGQAPPEGDRPFHTPQPFLMQSHPAPHETVSRWGDTGVSLVLQSLPLPVQYIANARRPNDGMMSWNHATQLHTTGYALDQGGACVTTHKATTHEATPRSPTEEPSSRLQAHTPFNSLLIHPLAICHTITRHGSPCRYQPFGQYHTICRCRWQDDQNGSRHSEIFIWDDQRERKPSAVGTANTSPQYQNGAVLHRILES